MTHSTRDIVQKLCNPCTVLNDEDVTSRDPAPVRQASSDEDAIRQLETQTLQRTQGTRQVSLVGTED